MKKAIIGLALCLWFGGFVVAQEQDILFSDNFESYVNGGTGAPVWNITKGFWQIEGATYFQKSVDYDCGALLDLYLDSSVEMSVDFKVVAGEPGAGFFFHSLGHGSTEFSHMLRFESDRTMLVGYFMSGGYEPTRSVRLTPQQFTGAWHTLQVKIDLDNDSYTVTLDGSWIATEPLVFRAGYCGLQSSGGKVQFDNFKLVTLPTQKKSLALNWVHKFIIDADKNIVAPNPSRGAVHRLNWQGQATATFGVPIDERGQLDRPVSVAQLSNRDYVVCDAGLHRIHVFDKKGNWKNSAGYAGAGDGQLNNPQDVCVDGADNILVADSENNRIAVWDGALQFKTVFGKDRLGQPSAIAWLDGKVYVLNAGLNRVEIFTTENGRYVWLSGFDFGVGQGRDILVVADKIYVSVGNSVRLFDAFGNRKTEFNGASISGIMPFGLALDQENQVCIADFKNSRILVEDAELSDPRPIVSFPSKSAAKIEMFSAREEKVAIRVVAGETPIFEKTSSSGYKHQFDLSDLTPSTVYHYQFQPTIRTIPPQSGFSKKYAFITPPAEGKKHFRQLPLATIIFTNVLDTAAVRPSWPEMPNLPKMELIRIKSEILDGIRFYWVNSGMNLFLDNEVIVVDEKLFRHEIFGSDWWYPPLESRIENVMKDAGKQLSDYVGILYLGCVRDYNEKSGEFELRGRGGGFTAGYGANNRYGLSYWEVTRAHHNSQNNWLMVHEFHHQLDELFMHSGYPEYWFCHFSPTINTADDFGEHFDGNAWILRNWPNANWYDLKFGSLMSAEDADMDGIPDDAPGLPLDEKRLQSSSRFADSDGDGVDDLGEVVSTNWIVEGCGENYGGAALFPNLLNPDTDGDGKLDNEDSYPLYPFEPKIYFSDPDARPENAGDMAGVNFFARLVDNRIHANVYARWDTSRLSFMFETDRLAPIKLMVDADANGWFIGRDNFLVQLRPASDLTLKTTLQINNCSDPKKWPFHDDSLARTVDLTATVTKVKENYLIRVTIPRNRNLGLNLEQGERIGVNIGYSVFMDAQGHQKYITIFEPNRFFDVDLAVRGQ
ncbi:MAG: NHL repeat-containing protein [Candidatus Zhuqueibacterota bacterium]